jgi:TPR repeat protein
LLIESSKNVLISALISIKLACLLKHLEESQAQSSGREVRSKVARNRSTWPENIRQESLADAGKLSRFTTNKKGAHCMKKLVLTLLLVLMLGASWADDFSAGLAAYDRKDYVAALKTFRALSLEGNSDAQYSLGLMLDTGRGVSQDHAEAIKWYRLAALQGHANAQFMLGLKYDIGRSVSQNYPEAEKWYRLAAAQGNSSAQYNLGGMYEDGLGVTQDYPEAEKWYRLAAAQGNSDAQFSLGYIYSMGHGGAQDYKEAAKWYELAAAQGNPDAQENLGLMYAKGLGVIQDIVRAHMWFNLSATGGNATAAKNRDFSASLMSNQQVTEAKKKARACQAKGLNGC